MILLNRTHLKNLPKKEILKNNLIENLKKEKKIINQNDLLNIKDNASFYEVMNCVDHVGELVLITCGKYHEVCEKCLKIFYELSYNPIEKILLDPYICPICRKTSIVEDTIALLNTIFGEEKIQMNFKN